MRALRVFARRPGALLALGAVITLLAPSCACGIGAFLLPPLVQELVRITLVEALRLGPERPAQPLIAKRSPTTMTSILVVLAVLLVAAISGSGVIAWGLGGSLGAGIAMWGALLGASAAGALLAPLVFLPYAAVERDRKAGDAFVHATRITGALPWGRVALVSGAVPVLLMAPVAVLTALPDARSLLPVLAAAATSTVLVPLVFCGLGATYAQASERWARLAPPASEASEPTAAILPSVSVALALLGLLGALLVVVLLRPATLEPVPRSALDRGGPLVALETYGAVSGTPVHLAAAEHGVRVSVEDGGGAGLIEGVPSPTAYRTEPRPEVCRGCFALEITNGSISGSTVLDPSGVRHDDGPAARLARGVGPLAWIAIGSAFLLAGLGTALARTRRRANATLLLLVIALLVAVLDLARALWR